MTVVFSYLIWFLVRLASQNDCDFTMRGVAFASLLLALTVSIHVASSRDSSSSSNPSHNHQHNHVLRHPRQHNRSQQSPGSQPAEVARPDSIVEREEGLLLGGKNCSRCFLQEEARSRRLEEVKLEILRKLGLSQAPNVTARDLPRIPPLQNLLSDDDMDDDEFSSGTSSSREDEDMLSDAPVRTPAGSSFTNPGSHRLQYSSASGLSEEFEDFYVNTEKSISFAKIRESLPFVPDFVRSRFEPTARLEKLWKLASRFFLMRPRKAKNDRKKKIEGVLQSDERRIENRMQAAMDCKKRGKECQEVQQQLLSLSSSSLPTSSSSFPRSLFASLLFCFLCPFFCSCGHRQVSPLFLLALY